MLQVRTVKKDDVPVTKPGKKSKKKHADTEIYEVFLCSKCNTNFENAFHLEIHMESHNEDYAVIRYKCGICTRDYAHMKHAKRHLESHIGLKYMCQHCGQKFSRPQNMNRHIKKQHPT